MILKDLYKGKERVHGNQPPALEVDTHKTRWPLITLHHISYVPFRRQYSEFYKAVKSLPYLDTVRELAKYHTPSYWDGSGAFIVFCFPARNLGAFLHHSKNQPYPLADYANQIARLLNSEPDFDIHIEASNFGFYPALKISEKHPMVGVTKEERSRFKKKVRNLSSIVRIPGIIHVSTKHNNFTLSSEGIIMTHQNQNLYKRIITFGYFNRSDDSAILFKSTVKEKFEEYFPKPFIVKVVPLYDNFDHPTFSHSGYVHLFLPDPPEYNVPPPPRCKEVLVKSTTSLAIEIPVSHEGVPLYKQKFSTDVKTAGFNIGEVFQNLEEKYTASYQEVKRTKESKRRKEGMNGKNHRNDMFQNIGSLTKDGILCIPKTVSLSFPLTKNKLGPQDTVVFRIIMATNVPQCHFCKHYGHVKRQCSTNSDKTGKLLHKERNPSKPSKIAIEKQDDTNSVYDDLD